MSCPVLSRDLSRIQVGGSAWERALASSLSADQSRKQVATLVTSCHAVMLALLQSTGQSTFACRHASMFRPTALASVKRKAHREAARLHLA
eukprot:scaffold16872_cov17-Tisochrysis_lutea.AAC.3